MSRERPTDAVTGMDPEFIRQEGESLAPLVSAFGAGGYPPFLTLSSCRNRSGHQDGCRREQRKRSCSRPHTVLRFGMNVRLHSRVKNLDSEVAEVFGNPCGLDGDLMNSRVVHTSKAECRLKLGPVARDPMQAGKPGHVSLLGGPVPRLWCRYDVSSMTSVGPKTPS